MVDTSYNNAISAYGAASKMLGNAKPTGDAAASFAIPGNTPPVGNPGAPSFPELLEGSINSSINSTDRGEEKSIKTLMGKAELHEMVTAVTNAELTVQTVVAIRDKMINAYQDILRMPI